MSDTWARIIRSLLQLVAGGALYGLTEQLAKDVPNAYAPYIILGYTLLVTVAQMLIEDATGKGILRKPGVPPAVEPVDEAAG